MKVLVTGVAGQLGHDVVNELLARGVEPVGTDIMEPAEKTGVPFVRMDLTDEKQVRDCVLSVKPDAVIHCAAWTAVDAAEEEENREKVHRINALGTQYIAEAAKAADAKMIYISTDYVFG